MTEHAVVEPTSQTLSLKVDEDLAAQIDSIARQDGVSRSEILRRLLLRNLQVESRVSIRCQHGLRAITGQLERILEILQDAESDEAAEFVDGAIDGIAAAIDELEGDEDEDE